jgi:hypothetical protein
MWTMELIDRHERSMCEHVSLTYYGPQEDITSRPDTLLPYLFVLSRQMINMESSLIRLGNAQVFIITRPIPLAGDFISTTSTQRQ